MPDWGELLEEIHKLGSTYDIVRRSYLQKLHDVTKRNIIIYYSGWLQKPNISGTDVNDIDMEGFMTVIHRLDINKGLDLILHTPGGQVTATESLVDYLRATFGADIRAFVPQLAMSAGTMIACACKEIFMGDYSSLGPIDPQLPFAGVGLVPAHGVVEEFEDAQKAIKENPNDISVWQLTLAKYPPAFIGECIKAIELANEIATNWLETGMFKNLSAQEKKTKSEKIVERLADHTLSKTHGRHFSAEYCRELGLKIHRLEEDLEFQDAVLSVHHACIHTLSSTPASKIIENHFGRAYIQTAS